jgi:hypothetical protein
MTRGAFALTLRAFLALALVSDPLSALSTLSDNQARFGRVEGDVIFLSQGATEWIDAHEGLPIEPGDRIYTEEDSRAEIALGNAALAFVQAESDVTVGRLSANEGNIHLTQGVLLGRVDGAGDQTPQKWSFETPGAVAAVRGTEFAIHVTPEKETRIGVFEGKVDVQPAESAEGPAPAVSVLTNQEALLARGKKLAMLSKFSEPIAPWVAWRTNLRSRHQRIQGTWSPFTPAVRQELRTKFVKPLAKKRARPKRPRQRKPPVNGSSLEKRKDRR